MEGQKKKDKGLSVQEQAEMNAREDSGEMETYAVKGKDASQRHIRLLGRARTSDRDRAVAFVVAKCFSNFLTACSTRIVF
jgi:hypothetical protein